MNIKTIILLIQKSNYLSQQRKNLLTEILIDSTPHKKVERKSAKEALNRFQIINESHKMTKMDSIIGMEELIETLNEINLKKEDYVDEILYFSTKKRSLQL